MKTYSHAPDADGVIEKIQAAHHEASRASASRRSSCSTTSRARASSSTRATRPVPSVASRPSAIALGVADATIVICRPTWVTLSQRQRDALIDHELTHLERATDKEDGTFQVDAVNRPKLKMRRHDHQFGWFDEVAQRHGEASPEVRQARRLMESSGQLYFDFEARAPAKGRRPRGPDAASPLN